MDKWIPRGGKDIFTGQFWSVVERTIDSGHTLRLLIELRSGEQFLEVVQPDDHRRGFSGSLYFVSDDFPAQVIDTASVAEVVLTTDRRVRVRLHRGSSSRPPSELFVGLAGMKTRIAVRYHELEGEPVDLEFLADGFREALESTTAGHL